MTQPEIDNLCDQFQKELKLNKQSLGVAAMCLIMFGQCRLRPEEGLKVCQFLTMACNARIQDKKGGFAE